MEIPREMADDWGVDTSKYSGNHNYLVIYTARFMTIDLKSLSLIFVRARPHGLSGTETTCHGEQRGNPHGAVEWWDVKFFPLGSMSARHVNIYHQYTRNVSIYMPIIYPIHGSYGFIDLCR